MSPDLERACMKAAGLVPITFEAPPADAQCAGKMRISKPQLYGLCLCCGRLGAAGIEPAAVMRQGVAVCVNFREPE